MKHFFLRKRISSLVVLSAVLLLAALPLSAQNAGYDLLSTGSGAYVNLSNLGLGNVNLQGQAWDGSLGTTDTIMHRTQNVSGGNGTTNVEVTALFLKSTSSVTYQGQPVDVYVTVNNSGGQISTSTIPQPDTTSSSGTVTFSGNSSGGTFNSSITVNADVILVKAGTSPTNSANYVGVGHTGAPSITLTSTGSPWSATAPSGYPSSSTWPSGGGYPQPVHNGPHPVIPAKCGGTTGVTQPTGTTATKGLSSGPSGQAFQKACFSVVSPVQPVQPAQ